MIIKNLLFINMYKVNFIIYFIIITSGYLTGVYFSFKKIFINHGPDSNKIKKIKFKHNNKCFNFKPKIRACLAS